jgi:hypothetical protein
MPELVFTLNQAKIRLYPLLDTGEPDTDNPIFISADAEVLRLSQKWEEIRHTPTGVKYPIMRQISLRHEIAIDRLWKITQPLIPLGNLLDFQMVRNPNWAMSIVWQQDDDELRYIGRMYYGVTCNTFDFGSRDMMEFLSNQIFQAQYFREFNGDGPLIPCV